MNLLEHWKKHETENFPDFKKDPLGLQNVCIPSEPLWLNKYHDKIQNRVFGKFMWDLNFMKHNFLELGCGTGRWSQRLYNMGWRGVGIDIQGSVIESNKRRIPGIAFHHGNIANFELPEKFELVVSVTVLQHLPPEDISKTLWWIRDRLDYPGRVVMLENISFKSATCFSRTISEWTSLFAMHGMYCLEAVPYDHSYFRKLSEKLGSAFRRQACFLDAILDPVWRMLKIQWGANHAGFVFTKY